MVAVLALITDNIIFLFMAIVSAVVLGIFLAHSAVNHVLSGGRLHFNLIFWVGTALSVLWVCFILWTYLP